MATKTTTMLKYLFIVLSFYLSVEVSAQSCGTFITSSVPSNSIATVTTFAGTGAAGSTNGLGTAASFNSPFGVANDAAGNVYVADLFNHLIRKITPAGAVSTFAGSGAPGNTNGTGTAASFNAPIGVACDLAGNVFVADNGNNLIRKITPAGVVTTLAGSGTAGYTNATGTAATFNQIFGLTTDAAGNVYVAERGNDVIRKITTAGVVSTFAGSGVAGNTNGTGAAASFNNPTGIDTDLFGNLYVADFGNNLIRKITPAGVVTTLAGSGAAGFTNATGTAASFNGPFGIGTDPAGNVFVAERNNRVIRKINALGVVTTLAGNGLNGNANGSGTAASFSLPVGITTDAIGNIYVADQGNYNIRRIVTNETVQVCPGSPLTLTASLGATYVWTGPQAITNGVSFNATLTGTYKVTVTDAGGCTSLDSVKVDVSLPTISAASSTPTVCINTAMPNITHTTSGLQGIGVATGLPTGVTASFATGIITISGTPSTSGNFNYTIPLLDGCGTVSATGTINVAANNTAGAASGTPTLCINTPLTPITHATTVATGIANSGVSGANGLPPGVSATWASNTITISGTPTAEGTFLYSIPSTGGCASANANGIIIVNPANSFTLSSSVGTDAQKVCLNTALSNISYNTTGATGAVFTGLPAGVTATFASNVVSISGTPTVAGIFNYTGTLVGGCGTVTGTITVASIAPAVGGLNACVDVALTPSVTHSTIGVTSIGSPTGLPPGVTAALAGNTITISGTPVLPIATYIYTIPITGVTGGCSADGTITVNDTNRVSLPSITPILCVNSLLPNITHETTTATGVANSGVSGANGLPAGVSATWASNTITISGTPTASGTFNYAIPLTGGCRLVNATGTITVAASSTVVPASATLNVCVNTPLTITHATPGATAIVSETGLPGGVTAAFSGNLTLSGTPTATGTFNYTVTLNGGCGPATGTITVISVGAPSSNPVILIGEAIPTITHATINVSGIGAPTGLPPGVTASWASNTITIIGTPTQIGTYNYSIPMIGGGCNATGTITVNFLSNPLDNLNLTAATPAAVAFGLRRLSSFYSGPGLQIRRSSDNQLVDVYFDGSNALSLGSLVSAAGGGAATATTLGTWIGTNSGTVAVWYDQTGLGRHAVAPTAAAQPRFILLGKIDSANGKPTLVFSGAQSLGTTATTTNCVGAGTTITSNLVFFQSVPHTNVLTNNSSGANLYRIQAWYTCGGCAARTAFFSPSQIWKDMSWPSYAIGTFIKNGGSGEVWQNSTNALSGGAGGNLSGASTMAIGSNLTGQIGEVTIFPSALTTTQRTALECNQANYYGIAVAAPNIALGYATAIPLGTTTASLPYGSTTATHYSITWSTAATSAGFVNVPGTLLPAGSIPVAVPATGPVAGQNYSGVLTVTNNCSGLSTNYGFNIYISGNNVLDNLTLTAATPSAVAYGLRKLSSVYNGPALRIRRSSDGEQRDVYFDATGGLSLTSLVSAAGGGEATATTLGSWIGASSGTVAVWYDQSGLGRNAFQTTAAAQPGFINAGAIELQNGKPTLIFSGAQSFQTTATTDQCVGAGTNITSNLVFVQSVQNWPSILSNTLANLPPTSSQSYAIRPWTSGGSGSTVFYSPGTISTTPFSSTNYSIGTFIRNGGWAQIWQNSTNPSSGGGGPGGTLSSASTMQIGSNVSCKLAELTIFPSGLSTAARTALECNQSNYYGIPVLAPQIALGSTNPVTLGTPTASLPYSYTTATNYSITWSAAAALAGFANVTNALLPAASITVAVPVAGPAAGQNYTGVLTVTNNCSGLSTNYSFNIYIIGNNVLDNLNLTAATPAAVAYGLRKLSSVYNGPALQIRRSSDGEQRDVYFDATGGLSTTGSEVSAAGGGPATGTTLGSWIGANSGTVAVWYDQSGLGRNAFQTTAAAQPRFINAGAIELQNGKPTLVFSGNPQSLQTTATTTQCVGGAGTTITSNLVFFQSVPFSNVLTNNSSGTDLYRILAWYLVNGNGASRMEFLAPARIWRDMSWPSYAIGTFIKNVGSGEVWQNSTNALSGGVGGNLSGASTMAIGTNLGGQIGELTIFPTALSTTERTALECNQANYFGIPVLAPQIALGYANAIPLGTTTANLPYSYTTATHYSITWSAAALLAGFANVANTLLPAGSIPVAVPAAGPAVGQNYTGVLTVTNNCSGLSTNYSFNIYIIGNNVLDNLNLTAATPAAVAYGLRKLSSVYNGPALQIRRSSDGEQRDVYFDATGGLSTTGSQVSATGGGAATTTTLGDWIGANSGTVAVWYDQSGLGRNAFQTTAAAQPRIINAGVIETQNGKPTLVFSGAQSFQTTATTDQCVGAGTNITSNLVFVQSVQNWPSILSNTLANSPSTASQSYAIRPWTSGGGGSTVFYSPGTISTTPFSSTNYSIGTFIKNATQTQIWQNRTSGVSGGFSGNLSSASTMQIGRDVSCKIAELTIFPTSLSTTERTNLECSQAVYFNINLPTVLAGSISPTICINTAMPGITHATAGTTGILNSGVSGANGLPAGVSATWSGNTITIAGTPTAAGTFNYSIPLNGGCGAINATGTIIVSPVNTWGAASSTPTICVNTTITNITHTTSGATGILNSGFSGANGLPAGVSATWSGNTITISGTPTVAGTYLYSIPLTGGCGVASATGTITVTGTGTINTTGAASTNPEVCMNTPITNITYATTGVTGIGVPSGLPPGVTASWFADVVTISGTPTAEGLYPYSIPSTGGCGNVTATGFITVNPNNTVTPASASPTLCINTALTPITHTTTGTEGIGAAAGLPPGVTASWADDVITITGTPTVAGDYNYSIPLIAIETITGCGLVSATGTIRVRDNTVSAASSTPTLCINTPLTTITHNTTGATGIGVATGLPAGVTATWVSNQVRISGTPTAFGTFNYSIPLTGGCVNTSNATGTIIVTPVNTVSAASSTPTLCRDIALTNITHTTTGATGISNSGVSGANGLPAGVSATWTANVITISGTPTVAGTFGYTIPLTGGCGTVNATGSITVNINTPGTASSNPTLCIGTTLTNITRTTTGATGIGVPSNLPAGVIATFISPQLILSGTPTESGTFNYSIPLTGGCGNVNATGTINVTQANTVTAASSTPTLCINTSIAPNITHTTTGATGISNNGVSGANGLPLGVSATWAGNVITISGTPTVAGTFPYSIPLTGGCGSVNATGTITVNAVNTAGAASSLPTLCINTVLTNITHATTGATGIGAATGLPAGVTAAWSANVITISGIPTASGTFPYSIPLIGSCGSANATGTITVTPNAAVTSITGTSPLCIGASTTYTANGVVLGGGTGAWSSSNPSVASVNAATGAVTTLTAGSTDIVYTITNGCGTTNGWTIRNSAADLNWQSVAFGNGLYVAVARGTQNLMTSPDGITWTQRTHNCGVVNWNDITYANGIFVAVASSAGTGAVMTSPDGITWTPRTSVNASYNSVTYGNGLFVATGTSGPGNLVMTSPDGITWTGRPSALNSWRGVTFGNGLFVAVAPGGGNNVMTSPDGINWTSQSSGVNNQWYSVTYGNGLYVAVAIDGTGNRVMTSPDGITWTSRTSAADNEWYDVTFGNGRFVAVAQTGAGNRVMRSTDGINWSTEPAAVDNNWRGVAFGNGIFVSVANSGTGNRAMTLSFGIGTVSAQKSLTVTATNTAGAASSTPTLCIGTPLTNITHATLGATGIGAATGLPAGVTAAWAADVITISGTPTASGTFNYSIPLIGSCGSANAIGTIIVTPVNTVDAASSTPSLCINTALTNITHATTGATGIGAATGLPAGVTAAWSANVITISGTPTLAGTFPYTIPLTGGCGAVNATGTITVGASTLTAVVSGTQTICSGSTATITIVVGGGTGSFTGTLNNGDFFTGTAPTTVMHEGLDAGTYFVTTLNNFFPCPSPPANLTGSAVITKLIGTPGLWTGQVSTDWFDSRNWACGTLPTNSDDVVIQASPASLNDCSIDPMTSFGMANGSVPAAMKSITINRALHFVNGGQLNVSGDWNGTAAGVIVGNSKVNFNGTAQQIINSTEPSVNFTDLTISNTQNAGDANEVRLNKPVNVSGVLTLTQGRILSTSTNLLTITTTGGVSGGSANSYVNGPMERAMNTTNEYHFPVGKPGSPYVNYRPPAVIPKTGAIPLRFRAEYFNSTPPDPNGYLDVIAGLVQTEWWQIDRRVGTDSAKVKLLYITPTGGSSHWAGPPPPDNNYAISIIKHSGTGNGSGGGNWYFTPNYTANQNSGFAVTGPEPETIPWFSQTGTPVYSKYISDFSPFGFGYAFYKLLPIRLVSFTGAIENKQALLNWTVADNAEVKSFTVEHSTNGSSFTGVGEVPKGSTASYKFYHTGLVPGSNYYRLVMHGKDGTKIYSNIVVLNYGSITTSITGIKPTLVRETTYVSVISAKNQNIHTRIFDTRGRLIRTEKTSMHQGSNTVPVLTHNLSNAMYIIVVLTDDGVQATFKVIKE